MASCQTFKSRYELIPPSLKCPCLIQNPYSLFATHYSLPIGAGFGAFGMDLSGWAFEPS
jgi:hypothetical protein